MKVKVQPIPIETLPPSLRSVCLRLERDLNALIDGGSVTEEQFKAICWVLEDWAVDQLKLLVRPTAKGSGAAA